LHSRRGFRNEERNDSGQLQKVKRELLLEEETQLDKRSEQKGKEWRKTEPA
jgi:hypothetical protein